MKIPTRLLLCDHEGVAVFNFMHGNTWSYYYFSRERKRPDTDRSATLEPPDISLEIKEKGRSGRGAGWEGLVTLETCQAVLLGLL